VKHIFIYSDVTTASESVKQKASEVIDIGVLKVLQRRNCIGGQQSSFVRE